MSREDGMCIIESADNIIDMPGYSYGNKTSRDAILRAVGLGGV
jgi:hypothetical protein